MDRRMKVRRGLAFLAAGLLFFHTPLGASAGETDPEARPQTAASPRAADNDASAGLDFQWTQYVPATETTYTAGGGQIVWTPKVSGGEVVSGTLTMKNAVIDSAGIGIYVCVPVNIIVEGDNRITSGSIGIRALRQQGTNPPAVDVSLSGTGSLKITSQGDGILTDGNITADTVRLEVAYGAASKTARGIGTTGGDIVLKNSKYIKARSSTEGIGAGSSAIFAGQAVGQKIKIENSHVIAINGNGPAINALAGSIELVSSDVRAVGNTSNSLVYGTLLSSGYTINGGTLFADNKGSDLAIPSVPSKPLRASNSAVLYDGKAQGLPVEGDLAWYVSCVYDETADEITDVGRGFILGNVTWNDNMRFGTKKSITIGYVDKPSILTIPKGVTVEMTDKSWFNVGNQDPQPKSRLINNGTININDGTFINNYPDSAIVNNGAINILNGGKIFNFYIPASSKGGVFQNNGKMTISQGGTYQNQGKLINDGTIDAFGTFSEIKLSDYDGTIDGKGVINGFLVEMHSDATVYAASGQTTLKTKQMLTLKPAAGSNKAMKLKVLEGARLVVEEGAVIDARTNLTKDTVASVIDLEDMLIINGELWLPDDIPEETLTQFIDKIAGSGTVNTGSVPKYIVNVIAGEESKTQLIERDGTVILPEDPVRKGYNFGGWYVKEGEGFKEFDARMPIRQSMEILSKWIAVNKWKKPLAIESWTYGEEPNEPVAEPEHGEKISYTYSSSAEGAFSDTIPGDAGTWYVKAFVEAFEEGLDGFTSLQSEPVSFQIKPKAYTEGGGITISGIKSEADIKNIVIKDGKKELVKDKDYTVTVTEDGAHVDVTITFKGNYTGTAKRIWQKPEEPGKTVDEEVPEEIPEAKPDIAKNSNTLNNKAKATPSSSKIKVTWGKVRGADGYAVYAEKCGNKIKLVKNVKGGGKTNCFITKIGNKKISSKDDYKIKIHAYRIVKGRKETIGKSLTLHVAGKDHRKYTNAKKLRVSNAKIILKKGKSKKIKAKTVKQNRKKSLFSKSHVAVYRYYSTNKQIADVSKNGIVKGRNKGACTVYAVGANGVKKGVKVTVK